MGRSMDGYVMRSPPAQRADPAMGEAAWGEVMPERKMGGSSGVGPTAEVDMATADRGGAEWPQTEYRGMSAWEGVEGFRAARGVAPATPFPPNGVGGMGLDTCLSAPTAARGPSGASLAGAAARGSARGVEGGGEAGSGDLSGGVRGLRAGSKSSRVGRKGAEGPLGSGRPAALGFGATALA